MLLVLLLLLALLGPLSAQEAQEVLPLEGQWLFRAGDDPSFSRPDLPEDDWTPMRVPEAWDRQGQADFDGYAWLRLRFRVDPARVPREAFLLVGTIDDADETFLNGRRIGSSGSMPPDFVTAFSDQRVYAIPPGLLQDENVLAVRIYDASGAGGITGGMLGIADRPTYERALNWGPAPKVSWHRLTTGNGMTTAVYDLKTDRAEVWPHVYHAYSEDKLVEPWLRSLRWETGQKPLDAAYVENTHVIRVRYPGVEVRMFAPFTTEKRRLYLTLEGPRADAVRLAYEGEARVHEERRGTLRQLVLTPSGLAGDDGEPRGEREVAWMRSHFTGLPAGLAPAERAVAEQSITVLKLAQAAPEEPEGARGQIVASLPPGHWNIAWLRDGAYSVLALSRVGLHEEAHNALTFFLKADCGHYQRYVWKDGVDYGVGVPYQMSVCRYFGLGKEETDFNADGPNIELDGFGLFLVAFVDYVERSGDRAFLDQWRSLVDREVADALLAQIGPDQLVRIDSGPWELHLPGRKNAYTSIVSAAGLERYGSLVGEERYRDAARRLREGIRRHLVYRDELIKGFAEATEPGQRDFYDMGSIEAFTLGVMDDPQLFASHFVAYEKALRVSPERGFARMNNPDAYSAAEWAFLDLRAALALRRHGRPEEARQLVQRIVSYAAMNFNLIPELYGRATDNYEGAVPMVGFGAGSYLLTLP